MKKILSSTWLVITIILIVPLIAFEAVRWIENKYEQLPVLSKMDDAFYGADCHFINQHNQTTNFAAWTNKILITDFFFTSCPTICPKMTDNMKRVAEAFKDDKNIQLLSFTVDPTHDSAEKLLTYAERKNVELSSWDFLTGKKRVIYKIARNQFHLTATDGDGGPQDFIHSDKIILTDKQNRIRGYYDGTSENETEQLIKDIKKLKNED